MTDAAPTPRKPRVARRALPEEPLDMEPLAPAAPPHLPQIAALRALSPLPTYIGVAVTALGFVLLGIAWGGVAGEANVSRQVPYVVSGGLAGLGLIIVGMTIVNVAAKRRDGALREKQIDLLAAALHELGSRNQ